MRNLLLGLVLGVAAMALLWFAYAPAPQVPAGVPGAASVGANTNANAAPSGSGTGPAPVANAASAPPSSAAAPPTVAGPREAVNPAALEAFHGPDPRTLHPDPHVADGVGTLTTDAVKAGVGKAKAGVKACYEQALQQNQKLGGKLSVEFVVAQSEGRGHIREARILEDDSDPAMLNPFMDMCVLKALGEVEYPATLPDGTQGGDGEVVVRFPFQFANMGNRKWRKTESKS